MDIPDEISLFEVGTDILNDTSYAELQRVFRSWIERVERAIDAGDYLASQIFSFFLSHSRSTPLWRV
jgi:hypothetical protein